MASAKIHAGHALLKGGAPEAAIKVGDQVTLELHVVHDGSGEVAWPTAKSLQGLLGSDAAVVGEVETSAPAPASVPGLSGVEAVEEVSSWTLQVLLAPGEHELGPFPVRLLDEGGEELDALELPPASLAIASVLDQETVARIEAAPDPAAAAAELAPPRGPWSLRSELPVGMAVAAGLGLLALAVAALWLWRRRPAKVREEVAIPLPPPEVVARERLSALPALLDRGEVFNFHVELAEILKVYLGRRHGADFVDSTTTEVRALLHGPLRSGAAVTQTREDIHRVLSSCDLVKFAEDRPEPLACSALLDTTSEIVERSTAAAEVMEAARESAARESAALHAAPASPATEAAASRQGLT